VGAGLLAKAVGQPVHVSLNHRIREQARSHIDRISHRLASLHDYLAHRLALSQIINCLGGLFQRIHLGHQRL